MKRAKRKKKTRCREKSVNRDPLPERRRLTLWKKAAFALVVLCLFFMGVEWVLSLAGVRPMLYEEDPYVGFSSTIPLFVEERNDEGQVIMVTAQNKVNLFNAQRFARDKAEGAYRIFVSEARRRMGGLILIRRRFAGGCGSCCPRRTRAGSGS